MPAGRSASAGPQFQESKYDMKIWKRVVNRDDGNTTRDLVNVLPVSVPYDQVDIRLLYGDTGIRGQECIGQTGPTSGPRDSYSLRRTFGGISDTAQCRGRYVCSCCRTPGTTAHPGSEHLKVDGFGKRRGM